MYDEGNMKTQDMFTATQNQFNNPNYTPDMSIGLEDESFLLLPSARVANKTIGASAVVTKELSPQADKIYLQTGITTDSFLRRNIHENASENTVDFLNGFDSKYPKVNVKPPYINWHTAGYVTRQIIQKTTE